MATTIVDLTSDDIAPERPSPVRPSNFQPALREAIQIIEADHLREVIRTLCSENATAVEWLGDHLLVQEDEVELEDKPRTGVKRKLIKVSGDTEKEIALSSGTANQFNHGTLHALDAKRSTMLPRIRTKAATFTQVSLVSDPFHHGIADESL